MSLTLTPTEIGTISAVGGVAGTYITSFLKGAKWPVAAKQALALACSILAALLGVFVSGVTFNGMNFAEVVSLVYLATQVAYQAMFRGSAVETALTKIGAKKPKPTVTAAKSQQAA